MERSSSSYPTTSSSSSHQRVCSVLAQFLSKGSQRPSSRTDRRWRDRRERILRERDAAATDPDELNFDDADSVSEMAAALKDAMMDRYFPPAREDDQDEEEHDGGGGDGSHAAVVVSQQLVVGEQEVGDGGASFEPSRPSPSSMFLLPDPLLGATATPVDEDDDEVVASSLPDEMEGQAEEKPLNNDDDDDSPPFVVSSPGSEERSQTDLQDKVNRGELSDSPFVPSSQTPTDEAEDASENESARQRWSGICQSEDDEDEAQDEFELALQ